MDGAFPPSQRKFSWLKRDVFETETESIVSTGCGAVIGSFYRQFADAY
jgi:hypothetical protein